jgi:hypothetical protein
MQAIRNRLQLQVLREVQLLLLQIIHHHRAMTRVVITSKVHGDSNKVMVTMEPRVTKRHTRSKVHMLSCLTFFILHSVANIRRKICPL